VLFPPEEVRAAIVVEMLQSKNPERYPRTIKRVLKSRTNPKYDVLSKDYRIPGMFSKKQCGASFKIKIHRPKELGRQEKRTATVQA
jgi:hypothetical protein